VLLELRLLFTVPMAVQTVVELGGGVIWTLANWAAPPGAVTLPPPPSRTFPEAHVAVEGKEDGGPMTRCLRFQLALRTGLSFRAPRQSFPTFRKLVALMVVVLPTAAVLGANWNWRLPAVAPVVTTPRTRMTVVSPV